MTGQDWDSIPLEMKWARQWLLAGPNEKGDMKVPMTIRHGKPSPASVKLKDADQWLDFETACEYALHFGMNIGYVLSEEDAYSCIDLDVKNLYNLPQETDTDKWTTPEQMDRFWKIVQAFESYTERSRGMQGLHVWVRGKIGKGCKHDGVEVYSQERFMVCTGSVVMQREIVHQQELLDILVAEIRARQGANGSGGSLQLVEIDEIEQDSVIIERAMRAGNADKFNQLCSCTSTDGETGELGTFTELGFRSQSEADLALMSMFTFYSRSNEQCRRLFRMSGLGKRTKAQQDDRYLNLTLGLVRTRQSREDALNEQTRAMAETLVQELQAQAQLAQQQLPQGEPQPLQAGSVQPAPVVADDSLPWPPGLAGAIAWHIFQSSPRPVKEISIVSALGLLAGICGRAYQIPQSGLNVYIILVGRSAIGKEAMHSGISNIMAELRESCPPVQRFVDFADFASGPALSKALAANKSFVNVAGEFGKKLKRLSKEDGRDAAMQTLRTVMTNVYQKSGRSSVVGGLTYSDKESNVGSVSGVAYSMIGETTPDTFYNALTEEMMEDGFLSRFTVVEYNGDRPALNNNPLRRMDKGLADALHQLVVAACGVLDRHSDTDVLCEPTAYQMLCDFNLYCDEQIKGSVDEGWRQMWNRAHLKVLRISALIAVADNPLAPAVYPNHVTWALDLVQRDIKMFQNRIVAGDIGTGDGVREAKLLSLMRDYLTKGASDGYGTPASLHAAGIIPRKILQIKCARVGAFTTHRLGATNAMDQAIRSLCDSGWIVEMDKLKLSTDYGFHGKAYRIINLPPPRPK